MAFRNVCEVLQINIIGQFAETKESAVTGRVEGKVALVTGAARGQGQAHAIRLAEEGADIIAVDICGPIEGVGYAPSTPDDLAATVKLVEETGRRIVASEADVRDYTALEKAIASGVTKLGRLDIVAANAGIATFGAAISIPEASWQTMLDINLTGVWHTVKAAVPHVIAGGNGGSLILTSSAAGLKGFMNCAHYTAAKHGVVGLMRTLAQELGPQLIRANTVHPTNVSTKMFLNDDTYRLFRPDVTEPTEEDVVEVATMMNIMPIPWVDPVDISNAVLFLASDEARYITGVALPVDAGLLTK
jgi:SDR family mycofactocin-dependent oxidoreductase